MFVPLRPIGTKIKNTFDVLVVTLGFRLAWSNASDDFVVLDLKRLYFLTGVENKPTVFLFNDTQALEESFLEDISNILSSGEVPNLYKPEEFEEVGVVSYFLSVFNSVVLERLLLWYQLHTFLLDFCIFYLKQGLVFLGSLV